jgi:mono/diheme cytochrome c family protein
MAILRRMTGRVLLAAAFVLVVLGTTFGHDPGAYLTWNREISRVFFARCADCHRPGGTAFSMMTYPEVQPHLTQIKNDVLNRRMPPWGAVKGFGDFRNDQGLTQEEIELIADWIDSDGPKGNNPKALPAVPKFNKPSAFVKPKGAIDASGDFKLDRAFVLDGLYPDKIPDGKSVQIVAEFPDNHREPLLWLYQYKSSFQHPFLFRKPLELPAGTKISGIPTGAVMVLLPGKKPAVK